MAFAGFWLNKEVDAELAKSKHEKQTGVATDFQDEILRVGSKRPVQLTAHEAALEEHHKQDPKERLQPESR